MRIPSLLSLAALLIAAAPSTPPQPEFVKQLQCAEDLLDRGDYLKATDLFGTAKAAEEDVNGPLHQTADQVTPFVTGHPADGPAMRPAKVDPTDLRRLDHTQLRDAIPEIVRRARHTNIVILNEEHLAPRDRAFALQVARALRPLGYSILAAESFHSSADPAERERSAAALLERGYPKLDTGFYTRDPVFGDFVRQSLALGYRPLVYEYVAPKGTARGTPRIAVREQGEAENLMRAVFSNDPTAKVLIYVGYSHAAEEPLYGDSWMAARLKRLTGADPLTIDQTILSPSGDSALYDALKNRLVGRSVVPMLAGKPLKFGDLGGAVDLQVAHPPVRLVHGRPDWLAAMGRQPVEIPRGLMPRKGRALIQAYLQSESEDAVPVDQLVVTAGETPPPLMVPPRSIRFKVRSGLQPGDCNADHKP